MQLILGLQADLDLWIWEMSVVPSFLTNSETWVGPTLASVTELEDLEMTFLRLGLPSLPSLPGCAGQGTVAETAQWWEKSTLPMQSKYALLLAR